MKHAREQVKTPGGFSGLEGCGGGRECCCSGRWRALLPGLARTCSGRRGSRISRRFEGIRDNQLVGYGIVVGLQGTGDSQQTTFPTHQTLAATLLRMGVSVPASAIRVQNLAAVFVSATLPPFARPGTKLDITASSAGDARSLEGGLLLLTPLYGADGKIYAQAQGPLVVGGYSIAVNGNTKQFNHPTTARIPYGAMVERALASELAGRDQFSLLLNDADFRSAEAMAHAINQGTRQAGGRHALDMPQGAARVWLRARRFRRFLARVESDRSAVLSAGQGGGERTHGHGGDWRNGRPAGGLDSAWRARGQRGDGLPGVAARTVSNGTTQVTPQTRIEAKDKPVSRIELKQGATVDDLVRSLQQIGASARDVISIPGRQ